MSNSDDGENNNEVAEENEGPPCQPRIKELDKAINDIQIVAIYNFGQSLKMCTVALSCEKVFMNAKIQKVNQKSISDYCLKLSI